MWIWHWPDSLWFNCRHNFDLLFLLFIVVLGVIFVMVFPSQMMSLTHVLAFSIQGIKRFV